jgi:cell division protein FtsA
VNGYDSPRPRKSMSNFWGKFKNSLIDIFKEEEDHQL